MLKSNHIHSIPSDYLTLYNAFKNGGSIREFINYIERAISNNVNNTIFDPILDDTRTKDNKINKYKGDMLEVFSEIFFKSFENDPTIGLKEYVPVSITDDFGVDAIGTNVNNVKSAVQVKYRANVTDRIDYESLCKTFTSGVKQFGIDPSKDFNIFLFTTCQGADFPPEKVLGKSLVVINRSIIATKVDNNHNFWDFAYKQIIETLGL